MKSNKLAKLLLATSISALCGTATAIPITGSIGLTGDYIVTGGTGLGDATGIDIIGDDATVEGRVGGTFAAEGITAGQTAYHSDFTFAPFSGVANLWTVGGFSFDLEVLSIDYQSSVALVLSGSGTIRHAGYDDTFGTWVFTSNNLDSSFTFSSSNAPEPGVALLLGAGLAAFGASRILRQS